MTESLRERADALLGWIKDNRGSGIEAEVYLSRFEERGIELRGGRLEGIQYDASLGMGLRVLKEGRIGFASASGMSFDAAKELYGRALDQIPRLDSDPHRGFPAPQSGEKPAGFLESLRDESLFSEEWEIITSRLKAMEDAARSADGRVRSVLRSGYGEMRSEVLVGNTLGVLVLEGGTSVSAGASVIAGAESEIQVGSSFKSARKKAAIDFEDIGAKAARRAAGLLGGKKISASARPVIFDPEAGVEFLDMVSGLLCADQIQRGKSLLAGRLGQAVASSAVSLVDDPRMPGGLASSLYDDEGLLTRKKTLIERGVLKDYFYDFYTSNKDGRASNGSAARGSFKGLPGPGSSNFYLEPGKFSREEIISGTREGIILSDVIGMHTADPISGEFSVGISGFTVERGRVTSPIKGAMLSGNILDLLKSIDAVASDLIFYSGTGCPTFRVSSLTVA